jgi:hypothetical protein
VRYFSKPVNRIAITAKARMIKLYERTDDDPLLVDARGVAGMERSSLMFLPILVEVVVTTEDVVVDAVMDETVCCTFPTSIER